MKVWIRQTRNVLIDSFRYGVLLRDGTDRVVIMCPGEDNVLIDCSRDFLDGEIARGRIFLRDPKEIVNAESDSRV